MKSITEIILLVWVLARNARCLNHIDDPEPPVTWTTPSLQDVSSFKNFRVGANYSGLLFAGTVEFNWIVDIRVADINQEYWATGNLVSFRHVLTTCRALDIVQFKASDDRDTVQEPKWKLDKYRKSPSNLRVSYCENYLWINGELSSKDVDHKLSGSRSVIKAIRHPECSPNEMGHDAAVLVLRRSIPALVPRIGFMPTGYDYVKGEIKDTIHLNPNELVTYTSPLCYVASFGRKYLNHDEDYVQDYKVKYRAYIIKWEKCTDLWDFVCDSRRREDCGDKTVLNGTAPNHLMCLRIRAKVGTVCDHDRGAPLVCNDQVVGLVIRGAEFKFCNNLYKIPFIVEKLNHVGSFITDTLKYVVQPVPRKGGPTTTPMPYSRACLLDSKPLFYSFFLLIYLGNSPH